jgi:hypothetical protein
VTTVGEQSPKEEWVVKLPRWRDSQDSLAEGLDIDLDDVHLDVYDDLMDPEHRALETARLRFRAAFRRRMRHRRGRDRRADR